jgi:L-ascorbate metabolism protein UlaG (beta-lactamase superfamily)
MDITWFGHSCFRLRDRSVTVVTDPYGKDVGLILPRVRADIVTVSHDADDHNYDRGVKSGYRLINGPGEYEVSGAFVTGLELRGEKKKGKEVEKLCNTVFLFEFEDLTVCHLGDLDHVPSQAQVEEGLGQVDVLLIPVGGGESLNAAQASEVVSLFEPHIVIPMHYQAPGLQVKLDPVSKFMKEMGLGHLPPQETLKVTRSTLPEETQVVLLELRSKEEKEE